MDFATVVVLYSLTLLYSFSGNGMSPTGSQHPLGGSVYSDVFGDGQMQFRRNQQVEISDQLQQTEETTSDDGFSRFDDGRSGHFGGQQERSVGRSNGHQIGG